VSSKKGLVIRLNSQSTRSGVQSDCRVRVGLLQSILSSSTGPNRVWELVKRDTRCVCQGVSNHIGESVDRDILKYCVAALVHFNRQLDSLRVAEVVLDVQLRFNADRVLSVVSLVIRVHSKLFQSFIHAQPRWKVTNGCLNIIDEVGVRSGVVAVWLTHEVEGKLKL